MLPFLFPVFTWNVFISFCCFINFYYDLRNLVKICNFIHVSNVWEWLSVLDLWIYTFCQYQDIYDCYFFKYFSFPTLFLDFHYLYVELLKIAPQLTVIFISLCFIPVFDFRKCLLLYLKVTIFFFCSLICY